MRVLILGSAAGGGFPQWNCRCPVCQLAWNGDPRVTPRTQSAIAVSADGSSWGLINASPDLRQQILSQPMLHPRHAGRHSPIASVLITNGEVDHIAGLLNLRERQGFTLFAAPETQSLLAANPIFRVLDPEKVRHKAIRLEEAFALVEGIEVTAFAVPGKVPLYMEDASDAAEPEDVIGLEVTGDGQRLLHIPNCARVTDDLRARIEGADLLLFDGTTFTDDEMPRLGLSPKTAGRMGHVAMDGPTGSLAALAGVMAKRKAYIHINNTNPVLIDGSPERRRVEAAGWTVAHDGMEFRL
ncbi:coenzyme PQQ synthesis protein B [Agaricicola taiwanensis]|uniref:Coenzyme PQQ synthesis protein B n=1 Tax=Agaricicola taiwanensis TaxID=591372 RepID=A0A8J2YKQ9_9RHOB|nr:pyrroloquinoline quinone biosynthesis protein PqqB [Agaricicola taiwanensis]GGE49085.1 coenzyme PQQ synthesis protein B [Agaricicola taiwanensis]